MFVRVFCALLRPWRARSSTAATLVTGLVLFALLDRSASMRRSQWGVDEGQRIAESYLLRLALAGQWNHPDWFRVITDSSHPQMNKYFFGVAALLAGVELPPDLALPRYYESGGLARGGWQPPPHLMPTYAPMLHPARRAALVCNIISWMAIAWLLLRGHGLGAALLASAIFVRHYLPVTFITQARSDALQTCSFTLALLAVGPVWRGARGWRSVVAAIFAGVFAAICFQTRLNGLLALGGVGAALVVLAARRRDRWPLVLALIATLTCGMVAVASNPYYWAQPDSTQGLAGVTAAREALPLRVVTRFRAQVAQLDHLLEDHSYAALHSPLDRVRFTARVLFSGVAGMILAAGLSAAVVLLVLRRGRESFHFACAWTFPVILVFALWLPLAWDTYVLMILPSAVLVAAAALSELASLRTARTAP